ncbi:MAG: CarD family transcriptional regulator [Candidatus Howiella sp.]|jgi:CarD family transcriptional regulator
MFQVNDTILYGAHGVCKITGETTKTIGSDRMEYLVLSPIYSEHSTIYVPKNNQTLLSRMHPLLSKAEIEKILSAVSADKTPWSDASVPNQEDYRELLSSGDRKALLCTVKRISAHRKELQSRGKKLHIADERFLKEAQKMISDEFAFCLGIAPEDVASFIRRELERLACS